jgi:hypothetical protein
VCLRLRRRLASTLAPAFLTVVPIQFLLFILGNA